MKWDEYVRTVLDEEWLIDILVEESDWSKILLMIENRQSALLGAYLINIVSDHYCAHVMDDNEDQ